MLKTLSRIFILLFSLRFVVPLRYVLCEFLRTNHSSTPTHTHTQHQNHTSIQQTWNSIFRGLLISLTNFQLSNMFT
jgi:hypothetical protein